MYPQRLSTALIVMTYIDNWRRLLLLLNRFEFEIIICTYTCIDRNNVKRGSVLPLLADGMIPENISSRMDKRMHLNRQLALRNRILNAAMLILHTFTRIPLLRRYDAANARRAFLLSACLVPRSPAMDNEYCISPSP